ncbi:ATP-binding cassette domain-containing protein [Priestia filamentosa]|uniref:ATP-binding cassette domain-containing protein n=1 Tax=Priestia filamentosa TaxID=1402861 RepID=UPI0039828410
MRKGDVLIIEYRSIEKFYPNSRVHAINDASFKIKNGEFVFKSRAGKTTLLKMLYKAEKPSGGTIMILGGDIKKLKNPL